MDQDAETESAAPTMAGRYAMGRYAMVRDLLDGLDGATLERLLDAVERQPVRKGATAASGSGMVRDLLGQPRAGA